MKKSPKRRSNNPINFALQTFGDRWSLLIIRDLLYYGKNTYCEFLDSEEGIATNILASRLDQLEREGILIKRPHPTDKRKEVYILSDKGLDLVPILLEIDVWSAQNDPQTNASPAWIAALHTDRQKLVQLVRQTVLSGGSIFCGPGSVITQLAVKA